MDRPKSWGWVDTRDLLWIPQSVNFNLTSTTREVLGLSPGSGYDSGACRTWILWWRTLPVHRTEFLPRTRREAHWPAFSAFLRSGNNIWWPRNSSDDGQSSTRCGRGRSIEYVGTDRPVTYPEIDWGYEFGSHIADHRPVTKMFMKVSINNLKFLTAISFLAYS